MELPNEVDMPGTARLFFSAIFPPCRIPLFDFVAPALGLGGLKFLAGGQGGFLGNGLGFRNLTDFTIHTKGTVAHIR